MSDPAPPRRWLGLDLGQQQDYTALADLEEHVNEAGQPTFIARQLRRFPLRTPYPVIVREIGILLKEPEYLRRATLIVDQTGCGRPVVDMFRAASIPLVGVTITGIAMQATQEPETGDWRVPKRDLASALQVVLQSRRLRVAPGIEDAQTFAEQLLNFRVKITPQGNDQYESWRDSDHDDIVLAVAMAVWYANRAGVGTYAACVPRTVSRPDPSRW